MGVRWIGGVLAVLLLACGSGESRMERGAVVDDEVAVPDSEAEMEMTEAQRRAAEVRQEQRASQQDFDEAEREAGR